MEGGEFLRAILAALCLPPRAPNRRWRAVEATVRRADALHLGTALGALRRAGLWEEALWLETRGVLAGAEARLCGGEVLTAACAEYPVRWRQREVGPGALWKRGTMPIGPFVSIVGSRHPTAVQEEAARALVARALESGFAVASGGAEGIDRVAAQAVLAMQGRLVEIVPEGIVHRHRRGCLLSTSRDGHFTAASALARNALLYGMAALTAAIGPRRHEGGTWHGAIDALRRRLGTVAVWSDGSSGVSPLVALGAQPIDTADALPAMLRDASTGSLGGLFRTSSEQDREVS